MELKITNDGSDTLYLPEMDEQYHSLNGAVTEANHVYINAGFRFHPSVTPTVFEVGFGTGLNGLLTASVSEAEKRAVFYIAIEKYPLPHEIVNKLNYSNYISKNGYNLFRKIHDSPWETPVEISPTFRLLKIHSDFISGTWQLPDLCDIIYFDAFGPDKQPEMWLPEQMTKIYNNTRQGGVVVTYSAKGEVRRRMAAAGFRMERLPGPPGKKEMLRGIKTEALLHMQKK